jgi:protein pelota
VSKCTFIYRTYDEDTELNQLTGIAAILTFPLDVEVVEAEEREAAEEERRQQETKMLDGGGVG